MDLTKLYCIIVHNYLNPCVDLQLEIKDIKPSIEAKKSKIIQAKEIWL